MSKTDAVASTTNPNVFPNSSVCLIEDFLPGVGEFRGSGVIIGPHTILTAAHVLWDADSGVGASAATITAGSTVIGGKMAFHYNKVDDRYDELSRAGSSRDFAVIDTARNLSKFGSFDIAADFPGGDVNVSGYPANRGQAQIRTKGAVTPGPVNNVLNYNGFSLEPGYSGGPVWVNEGTTADPQPAVAGLVSTTRWASALTSADERQIERWEAQDTDLYTDRAAKASVGEATSSALNGQAAAAALITGEGLRSSGLDAAAGHPSQALASAYAGPGSDPFTILAGHDVHAPSAVSIGSDGWVRHG